VTNSLSAAECERQRRWRLVLGEPAEAEFAPLDENAVAMDRSLGLLYELTTSRGLARGGPHLHRWLVDIDRLFPTSVAARLRQDAWQRLKLDTLLADPAWVESVEPDAQLLASLLALKSVAKTGQIENIRTLIERYVLNMTRRLRLPIENGCRISGHLPPVGRKRNRRVDWSRTILKNLRHFQPAKRKLLVERITYQSTTPRCLGSCFVCVDQSASMAPSLIHAGIIGSILSRLPVLDFRLLAFDTRVVDLTSELSDPVALLLGLQLGGGTDLSGVLQYCTSEITRASKSVIFLVSDFRDGGRSPDWLARLAQLMARGVRIVCFVSLDFQSEPTYDATEAQQIAALGIPVLACTPDRIGEWIAAALTQRDFTRWASQHSHS
jgi:hypothetical protein